MLPPKEVIYISSLQTCYNEGYFPCDWRIPWFETRLLFGGLEASRGDVPILAIMNGIKIESAALWWCNMRQADRLNWNGLFGSSVIHHLRECHQAKSRTQQKQPNQKKMSDHWLGGQHDLSIETGHGKTTLQIKWSLTSGIYLDTGDL